MNSVLRKTRRPCATGAAGTVMCGGRPPVGRDSARCALAVPLIARGATLASPVERRDHRSARSGGGDAGSASSRRAIAVEIGRDVNGQAHPRDIRLMRDMRGAEVVHVLADPHGDMFALIGERCLPVDALRDMRR